VLFEIDLDKRAVVSTPWKIVDIDDFMAGNDYLPSLAVVEEEKK